MSVLRQGTDSHCEIVSNPISPSILAKSDENRPEKDSCCDKMSHFRHDISLTCHDVSLVCPEISLVGDRISLVCFGFSLPRADSCLDCHKHSLSRRGFSLVCPGFSHDCHDRDYDRGDASLTRPNFGHHRPLLPQRARLCFLPRGVTLMGAWPQTPGFENGIECGAVARSGGGKKVCRAARGHKKGDGVWPPPVCFLLRDRRGYGAVVNVALAGAERLPKPSRPRIW